MLTKGALSVMMFMTTIFQEREREREGEGEAQKEQSHFSEKPDDKRSSDEMECGCLHKTKKSTFGHFPTTSKP